MVFCETEAVAFELLLLSRKKKTERQIGEKEKIEEKKCKKRKFGEKN